MKALIIFFLESNKCEIEQQIYNSSLKEIENEMIEIVAENNTKKVKSIIEESKSSDGGFSQLLYWKLKRKLIGKDIDPPSAKVDKNGALVTSQNMLNELYLNTYIERLSPNEESEEIGDILKLKNELWKIRSRLMRDNKTEKWSHNPEFKSFVTMKSGIDSKFPYKDNSTIPKFCI